MDKFLKQYLITALWSEIDSLTDEPLDKNFNIDDFSPESLEQAENDCKEFIKQAGSLLDGLDLSTAGHDFWLTRNRHGAGFWDGDYKKSIGEQLTKLAHSFGELNLYAGDNGLLYF